MHRWKATSVLAASEMAGDSPWRLCSTRRQRGVPGSLNCARKTGKRAGLARGGLERRPRRRSSGRSRGGFAPASRRGWGKKCVVFDSGFGPIYN